MLNLAFLVDLLGMVRMAEIVEVKEVMAIGGDNGVKIEQEVEVAKRIILMLDAIVARKRSI